MPTQTFETPLPQPADEVFAWHARPGAFGRLCPPWQPMSLQGTAPIREGSVARLRLKKGPLWVSWEALHRDVEPGRGFTDEQIRGPFSSWVHRHDFLPDGNGSLLRDRITYELPAAPLGAALAGGSIRRDIETTFAYRHRTTARDLARHHDFPHNEGLRVAVSGAGGLVGRALVPFLTTGGHEVVRLVRGPVDRSPDDPVLDEPVLNRPVLNGPVPNRPVPDQQVAGWDPSSGLLSPASLGAVDALVHLAGESIADGRWTPARKQRIRDSRVAGTRNLVRSLAELESPPKTLVCASAIGFYGDRGEARVDEGDPGGGGFLAEVCEEWEAAARQAAEMGIRVVSLRFGIILSPAGGALAKMLPPFRLGLGGRIGDGRQYMSWVSIDDALGAVHRALLDERLTGPVNVVAPSPVTNRQFTRTLGRVLARPTALPLPAIAARVAFGEMAEEMLLAGSRVEPRKLEDAGHRFDDADLEPTLERLLGKVRS